MRDDYTHLAILLDRSGSMSGRWNDTIGGLQQFFDEQKVIPSQMTLSLAVFDQDYGLTYDFANINNVKGLDLPSPRGNTALYDSFCKLVDQIGDRLSAMNESDRPGKIIFVVVTDGEENSSKEFGIDAVKQRLETQRDVYSWNFLFLGANFDNVRAVGKSVGNRDYANIPYADHEVKYMYSNVSRAVAKHRNSGQAMMSVDDYLSIANLDAQNSN